MNNAKQGPIQTASQRFDSLPPTLETYAKDIEQHGAPVDSGLPEILRFVADQITRQTQLEETGESSGVTAAERDRLREQRDRWMQKCFKAENLRDELLAACKAYVLARNDGGVSMADLSTIADTKIRAAIANAEGSANESRPKA